MTYFTNHCEHETFNKKCAICSDVMGYCDYAQKEGFMDFDDCYDGHGQLTNEGWEFMKKYKAEADNVDIDQHEQYDEEKAVMDHQEEVRAESVSNNHYE